MPLTPILSPLMRGEGAAGLSRTVRRAWQARKPDETPPCRKETPRRAMRTPCAPIHADGRQTRAYMLPSGFALDFSRAK
jgi:hypothetical protein